MFERRLQFLLICLGVVLFCLVARAVSVQVVGRSYWQEEAADAQQNQTLEPTVRGRILDCKGRELAVDLPCIDACVDYRAIKFDHTGDSDQRWLNNIARNRIKARLDNYADLPLAERKKLLSAEVKNVLLDIDQMWIDLATVSHQKPQDLSDLRRQIIAKVEARRQIVWSAKYGKAVLKQSAPQPWYVRWLGGGGDVDVEKFEVNVAEQTAAHVILPHISYELRNELAQQSDRYPGLVLQAGVMRSYPYGSAACQTIGRLSKVNAEDVKSDPNRDDPLLKYTANDDIGRDGLEAMLEDRLRGKRGVRVTDAAGHVISDTAPVPGEDVQVTLDIALQAEIEKAFNTVKFHAGGDVPDIDIPMPGAAVVIDVPTGEVRALVSAPTYDLNQIDDLLPKLLVDKFNRPLINRAISNAAQPGSTVKPIVGLGAITQGIMHADQTILCSGFLIIGKHKYTQSYRCWTERLSSPVGYHKSPWRDPHPNGYLTFADALERSCNVFHETLGDKLGVGGLSFWFDKFGLGRKTGIGLPGEVRGSLPDQMPGPKPRSMAWNSAIGEEDVTATPIQMANVAATIARGGIWMKPTLQPGETERVDLHLDPAAVEQAHIGMKNVVGRDAGTGNTAFMRDVLLAGKTGSAQTSPLVDIHRDPVTGKPLRDAHGRVKYDIVPLGTSENPNPEVPWYRGLVDSKTHEQTVNPAHAWMIGYAPADQPKLAFACFVEHGGSGGVASGSIVKGVVAAAVDQGYIRAVPNSGVLPPRPPYPSNPKVAFGE